MGCHFQALANPWMHAMVSSLPVSLVAGLPVDVLSGRIPLILWG
jgi:hypothetical protein